MTSAEVERIRAAAVELGRKQRREQLIPERITDSQMTARLVSMLAVKP